MEQCRICFEDASLNGLIAPCLCDGTSKYVHTLCLDRWRRTSDRAFFRCSECNFRYKITYDHAMETFTFADIVRRGDPNKYFFLLIVFLISGFFIRILETELNYPSLRLLNLDLPLHNKSQQVLKNDEIYSGCYYFSLNNFILSIFFYICFFIVTLIKIKRIGKYWHYFKIPYLIRVIFCFHFVWVYWLFGHASEHGFEIYVTFESFLSLFNTIHMLTLLEDHNKIIIYLNTRENKSNILEPTPEELL